MLEQLLQITRSSHYGDSMERVLYNTILGARPTLWQVDTAGAVVQLKPFTAVGDEAYRLCTRVHTAV